MIEHFIDKKEAAEFLQLSERSIDYFRKDGNLPSHVTPGGGRVLFLKSELFQWLTGRKPETAETEGKEAA